MKTLKKLLTLAALVLFAMTLTSCKAIFGDGEITVKYAISTVVIALLCFILDVIVCISAEKHGKGVGWAFLDMIIILVPFFWRPFAYFNLLVLGISLVLFFIGLGVSGNQTLKDNAAAEAKATAEAAEKERAGKLLKPLSFRICRRNIPAAFSLRATLKKKLIQALQSPRRQFRTRWS